MQDSNTDNSNCTATYRDGSSCRAWPVRGEDKCRMHLGKSPETVTSKPGGRAFLSAIKTSPT